MRDISNNLGKYQYNNETKTLHWEWQPETLKATWPQIMDAMHEYATLAESYKAVNHIIDEQKLKFTYLPDYQVWIDKNISPRVLKSGCRNYAVIVNKDIFMEMAVQQIFEEENASRFRVQFFDSVEEGEKWLHSL